MGGAASIQSLPYEAAPILEGLRATPRRQALQQKLVARQKVSSLRHKSTEPNPKPRAAPRPVTLVASVKKIPALRGPERHLADQVAQSASPACFWWMHKGS